MPGSRISTSPTCRSDAIEKIQDLLAIHQVAISGLGYYPNLLTADQAEAECCWRTAQGDRRRGGAGRRRGEHIRRPRPGLSVDDNWPRFLEVWRPLIAHAESQRFKIGIENCPMLFTGDEWPGGKNLATTPCDLAADVPGYPQPEFRPELRPLAPVWQQMDYVAPLAEFKDRIFHVHAKDARIDRAALDQHGVLAYPKLWHTPKIPGLGDVRWGASSAP